MTFTIATEEPIEVNVTRATEFVVVSEWAPIAGKHGASGLNHETFTDLGQAEDVYAEYKAGEYPRATAVCIFASRHGIPIGRIA